MLMEQLHLISHLAYITIFPNQYVKPDVYTDALIVSINDWIQNGKTSKEQTLLVFYLISTNKLFANSKLIIDGFNTINFMS